MAVWSQGGGQTSLQGVPQLPHKLPSHLEEEQGGHWSHSVPHWPVQVTTTLLEAPGTTQPPALLPLDSPSPSPPPSLPTRGNHPLLQTPDCPGPSSPKHLTGLRARGALRKGALCRTCHVHPTLVYLLRRFPES